MSGTSEQSITVAAGENKTVDVRLVADKGARLPNACMIHLLASA